MDAETWIAQLGRLYKEVSTTEGPTGANAYVDQFNRILSNLNEEFPENSFIQNTEPARRSTRMGHQADSIKEVKMKCGQLADVLGYEIPESELEKAGDITVISLQSDQTQTADQTMTLENSIEQAMEMINYTTLNQPRKEELREIVRSFGEELDNNADPTVIRDLIKNAKDYSVDVSAKMAMIALSAGLVDVLGI